MADRPRRMAWIHGVQCLLVDEGPGRVRVDVLEGEHTSRAGWVVADRPGRHRAVPDPSLPWAARRRWGTEPYRSVDDAAALVVGVWVGRRAAEQGPDGEGT